MWWQEDDELNEALNLALVYASKDGDVAKIRELLDKGANVNATKNVSPALAAFIARTAVWRVCGYGG